MLDQFKKIVERQTETKDLAKKGRKGNEPIYRGMFIELSRKYTNHSLAKIGKIVGRDHATAIHWEKNLEAIIQFNPKMKKLYAQLDRKAVMVYGQENVYNRVLTKINKLPDYKLLEIEKML